MAGATKPVIPAPASVTLYDGPLGGVPAAGYAYWGYDFISEQVGTPSPVRQDEFINRSNVPVTITLSFNFPLTHPCDRDCLAGVEFEMGPGWRKVDPPYVKTGDTASVSAIVPPHSGYAWIIGLWESTHPRLTITIPKGSSATLQDVGLVAAMSVSDEVPRTIGTCQCDDGTLASCSDGDHFSNGLIGPWSQGMDGYTRAGAFDDCPMH